MDGSELPEYQAELDEVLDLQAKQNDGERPLVATVTDEEKEATLAALREAVETQDVSDVEEWLESLCKEGASDVSFCDHKCECDVLGEILSRTALTGSTPAKAAGGTSI